MHKIIIKVFSLFLVFLNFTIVIQAKTKSENTNKIENQKEIYKSLELFNKVLFIVEKQYYRDVDMNKMLKGAIKGMLDTLDPHSTFLTGDFLQRIKDDTSGEFGGVGIEVTQKDGVIYIISPIDDSPAYKAGIKAGDKIISINGESTLGMDLEEAVKLMKGKENSKLKLGIAREGESKNLKIVIVRKKIKIKPIKSSLIEKNYLFLRLGQFQNGSSAAILKELKKYPKDRLKGIVLDLRSNPGGLLEEAIKVGSIFIKDGVLVSTEGRDSKFKEIRYVLKNTYKNLDTPMIVLINGASASASEIVAGALQDHGRAIVMGARSFGKGTVQTVAPINNESALKLTIAQYMTPKNRKIQVLGITPDIQLDELDAAWIREHKIDTGHYIREVDLKGHFEATIQTKEEKDLKNKIDKEKRHNKILTIKEDKLKSKKPSLFKKYQPESDYQVIQAINYLKSFKVLNNIRN